MKRFFNGETASGRANVAKATYASFALLYVYYRVRRATKTDPPEVPPENENPQPQCHCEACRKQCEMYMTPAKPAPESPAGKWEPKLSIPEDPLFKSKQKNKCGCHDQSEDDDDADDDDYACK